ncbi:hypothetical protein [Alicyclobacillus dauci]|uniref:Uncharacterized protein n=1 Tax=Alicyclobacillus dauci TaxID=1475485 RepID=A0ABY6Z8M9_9BACL|nr:hypothetical protein [Alicyclobacillus dauci]WAH38609.1 hypothetical protein NZD86_09060 [Alicyclobacillus dauci]
MGDKDLSLKVNTAPWFALLCKEFTDAGQRALEAGVRPDIVYESIRAALLAVVTEALQVNVES